MGAKQTSPKLSINPTEWIPLSLNSHYRKDYGKYQIYQNKISGKLIEKFDIFINDQEQFQQFQRLLFWRNNCEYVVGIDYHQFQKQQQICSTGYNGQIFIPHMPLRLCDVTDIPFPQNLYVLLAALKGFQYIFSYPYILHNFQINQNLICINQRGQVKVWMNVNLSYNFPDKFKRDHITQEQILKSIIELVQQNTDIEGNAYPFRQYLNDRKTIVNGDFDLIIRELLNYSKQMNVKIPSTLYSVKQLLGSDIHVKIDQSPYNQNKQQKYQNHIQGFKSRNLNELTTHQKNSQNPPIQTRTIRPRQIIKTPQIQFKNVSNFPIQFSSSRQNLNQNQQINIENKPIKHFNQRENDFLQTPSFGLIKNSFQNKKVRSISQKYGNNILMPYSKNINIQKPNYVSEFSYPEKKQQTDFRQKQFDMVNSLQHNLINHKQNQNIQTSVENHNFFVLKNPSIVYPNRFPSQNKITFNQKRNQLIVHQKLSNYPYPSIYNQNCVFRSNKIFEPSQIEHQSIRQPIYAKDGRLIIQPSNQYQKVGAVRSNSIQMQNHFRQNNVVFNGNIGSQKDHLVWMQPKGNSILMQSNSNPVWMQPNNHPFRMQSNNMNSNNYLKKFVNQQTENELLSQQKQTINKQIYEDLNKLQNNKDMKYFLSKNNQETLDPDIAADLAKYLT